MLWLRGKGTETKNNWEVEPRARRMRGSWPGKCAEITTGKRLRAHEPISCCQGGERRDRQRPNSAGSIGVAGPLLRQWLSPAGNREPEHLIPWAGRAPVTSSLSPQVPAPPLSRLPGSLSSSKKGIPMTGSWSQGGCNFPGKHKL